MPPANQFYRVSSLTGMPVALGERSLGKVSEAVINDGGCVQYLVVQTGSDAFVAVPWGAAAVDFGRRAITLRGPDVTPDALRLATFTAESWPNFTDPAWSERTQTMWGTSSPRVGPGTRGAATGTGGTGTAPAPGTTKPGTGTGPATGTPPPAAGTPGTTTPGTSTPRPGTSGTTPGTPGTTPPATPPGKGPGGPGQ
jgi:hypothetical protein